MQKLAKEDLRQYLKDSFVEGVSDAVKGFEKSAEYNKWMSNPSFKEDFTGRMENLVIKVKRNSST